MARLTDIMKEEDPCWNGYKQLGMKKKGNREVPNCVPESVNEGHFGEIDIMANEAEDFRDFVKEFYKEYKNFPKNKDSIKWLEGIYRGRSKNESLNEITLASVVKKSDNFKEFVKEFYKEYKDFPKDRDTIKWLSGIYTDIKNGAKTQSISENSLSDLEKKLKSHDWWYAYSDDNRKYKSGETNWFEITKIIKGMKGNKEAEKLWNKYVPKDFNYSFKELSETQLDEGIFKIGIKHIIPLIPTGYAPNDPKYKMDLRILRNMLNSFYNERGYDKVILPTF